jgi:hypothetical protein
MPRRLRALDKGKILARVHYFADHAEKISPEELYQRLNPEDIASTAEIEFSGRAKRIETWRNLFLFLPIIATWFSLAVASAAFLNSRPDPHNPDQSFFSLWMRGFPTVSLSAPTTWITVPFLGSLHIPFPITLFGHHWFTFGHVALLDFGFLCVIMILTVLAHRSEVQAQRDAAEIGTWLRNKLHEFSQQSLIHSLGDGPGSKSPQWVRDVHGAINHLTTVLAGVETTVASSQKEFQRTIDHFSDAYQMQRQAVGQLIENTQDINSAITRLLSMQDLYIRLEGLLPKMETHFQTMARQEERTANALAAIAARFEQASQAIVTVAEPFQTMSTHQLVWQVREQHRLTLELLAQERVENMQLRQMRRLFLFFDPRRLFRRDAH